MDSMLLFFRLFRQLSYSFSRTIREPLHIKCKDIHNRCINHSQEIIYFTIFSQRHTILYKITPSTYPLFLKFCYSRRCMLVWKYRLVGQRKGISSLIFYRMVCGKLRVLNNRVNYWQINLPQRNNTASPQLRPEERQRRKKLIFP